MQRWVAYRWRLGLVVLVLACSSCEQSEKLAETISESTISQMSDLRGGKTSKLYDPSPSLIEELVNDAGCARSIKSLYLSDMGVELSDPRYRELRNLPQLESIVFYCTQNTDTFLSRIEGMASLKAIETELADVSDDGMKHVAKFPNLTKLVLYGGLSSLGNAGLAELEGHKSLETLELINTGVSNDGLSVLCTLPNLKTLVLFWEEFRGERLTDASLKHLGRLTQLEELELSGGWASEEMAERLRAHLPDCEITSKGTH